MTNYLDLLNSIPSMLLQQADSIYCYACPNIWNVYHFMFNTKLPYINLAQNYVAYRITDSHDQYQSLILTINQ